MNNKTPFKTAQFVLNVIFIVLLSLYCMSSFINIFTNQGIVDEHNDFIISFLLLWSYASKEANKALNKL